MFDPAELVCTGNRYTDQFVAAAKRLGLLAEVINRTRSMVLISGHGRRLAIRAAIVGCNGMAASRISSNKFLTSTRLRNAGFRVPEFRLCSTHDYDDSGHMLREVGKFASSRFPVVVKPVRGHGGIHVYAGIADADDLAHVIDAVWHAHLGDVMIERHVQGLNYRVRVLDGEPTDLTVRYPAFVTGDGQSTICELIAVKNLARAEQRIHPIRISDRMHRCLERAGLGLNSVLPVNSRQQLLNESNQSRGGEGARLPVSMLSSGMTALMGDAARTMGLRWAAVDLIVKDIGSPVAHEECFINETNSAPAPNEYIPGDTEEEYLHQADLVLRRYFELR